MKNKRTTRDFILSYIYKHGRTSRVVLASKLGITKAGLTLATQKMLAEGLLVECGTKESKHAGRREVMLDINKSLGLVLGVSYERNIIDVTLSDIKGEDIVTKEFLNDGQPFSDKVLNLVEQYKDEISLIGITYYKDIDDNINDLNEKLSEFLKAPIFIENNVKALAKAHILFDYEGVDNYVFLKYGPGIGTCIVYQGNIVEESNEAQGIGQYIMDDGQTLEDYASYNGIAKRIGVELNRYNLPAIVESNPNIKQELQNTEQTIYKSVYNYSIVSGLKNVYIYGYLFNDEKLWKDLFNFEFKDLKIRQSSLTKQQISKAAIYLAIEDGLIRSGGKILTSHR